MHSIFVLNIFVLISSTLTVAHDNFVLRNIHILFRHGDRSWIEPLPSAPNFSTLWPDGLGQLTDLGILGEFKLGEWIRSQYGGLISERYNRSQFHMRSTDVDRTLMSAESFIAGLYKGGSTPLNDSGINWHPVPVHTIPQESDYMFHPSHCPRLKSLQKAQMDSDASLAYESQHKALFDLLSHRSGLPYPIDRKNLWKVTDPIICLEAHQMPLPDWASEGVIKELKEASRYYWWLLIAYFNHTLVNCQLQTELASDDRILRLEIGLYLRKMVEHFRAVAMGTTLNDLDRKYDSIPKIMAYSAHDTDITFLLGALSVYDKQLIEYSSAVIVELWGPEISTDTTAGFAIRIRYKRGWKDEESIYLQYPWGQRGPIKHSTTLDSFLEKIDRMLLDPDSREQECRDASQVNSNSIIVVVVTLLALFILGSMAALLVWYYRRRASHSTYSPVA